MTSLATIVAISAVALGGRASPAQSPPSKTPQFPKDQDTNLATSSSDQDIISARRGWLDGDRIVADEFVPSHLTKFKALVVGKTARVEATWNHWRQIKAEEHEMEQNSIKKPFVNDRPFGVLDKSNIESMNRLYPAKQERAEEIAVNKVYQGAKESLLAKEEQRQLKKIGHHP